MPAPGLTDADQAMLDGKQGPVDQMAMRLISCAMAVLANKAGLLDPLRDFGGPITLMATPMLLKEVND